MTKLMARCSRFIVINCFVYTLLVSAYLINSASQMVFLVNPGNEGIGLYFRGYNEILEGLQKITGLVLGVQK